MRFARFAVLALACFVLASERAAAQAEGPAGVRATGMGGAFVAVTDDASAVFWNPAALASGSYFSLVLDRSALDTPTESLFRHKRSALLFAIGTPPLGLSYYRTRTSRFVDLVAAGGQQSSAGAAVRAETLTTHNAGITVVQSLVGPVAVGATFRAVHGVTSTGIGGAFDYPAAFVGAEASQTLNGTTSSNKFDVDLGVLAAGEMARAGLSIRNLLQPTFGATGASIRLDRRIRAGVAVRVLQTALVAADVDLTRTAVTRGDWRDAAIGAEAHPIANTWLRAGVHWNTVGGDRGAAPVTSLGGSYAVYGSILADGQVSVGSVNGDRGWGVGLRFVY